jgi:hypothetical protein
MHEGRKPRRQAVRDRKLVLGQRGLHRTGLAGYLDLILWEAIIILGLYNRPLTRGTPSCGGLRGAQLAELNIHVHQELVVAVQSTHYFYY